MSPTSDRPQSGHPVSITLRPFLPADQAAARRLILEGLGEHFGWVDESCNPDLADIAAHYLSAGHIFLVAEAAGELVGTGGLRLDGHSAQIVRVSVAVSWRRRGLGRRLVGRLLDEAHRRGVTRVWVETNDDWADAIALYRACGMEEFDRRDGSVYLELPLGPAREFPPNERATPRQSVAYC